MSVRVTGILRDPIGALSAATVIRIVATGNLGETLQYLPASVITGADGSYDFTLVDGVHTIEVNFSSKYNLVGSVTVAGVMGTMTLPALLVL